MGLSWGVEPVRGLMQCSARTDHGLCGARLFDALVDHIVVASERGVRMQGNTFDKGGGQAGPPILINQEQKDDADAHDTLMSFRSFISARTTAISYAYAGVSM